MEGVRPTAPMRFDTSYVIGGRKGAFFHLSPMIHIGLDHLAYNAHTGDLRELAAVTERASSP